MSRQWVCRLTRAVGADLVADRSCGSHAIRKTIRDDSEHLGGLLLADWGLEVQSGRQPLERNIRIAPRRSRGRSRIATGVHRGEALQTARYRAGSRMGRWSLRHRGRFWLLRSARGRQRVPRPLRLRWTLMISGARAEPTREMTRHPLEARLRPSWPSNHFSCHSARTLLPSPRMPAVHDRRLPPVPA